MEHAQRRQVAILPAMLLRRVYDVDALACPCGGELRFIELVDNETDARAFLAKRANALCPDASKPLDDVASPMPEYDLVDALPDYDLVDAPADYDADAFSDTS